MKAIGERLSVQRYPPSAFQWARKEQFGFEITVKPAATFHFIFGCQGPSRVANNSSNLRRISFSAAFVILPTR